MADTDPVVIEELEGDRRSVVLDNSARPQRGLETGSQLVAKTTWYPGAKAASVQVLGIQEDTLTLDLRLSDQLIGTVGGAQELLSQLRAIHRARRLCELSWGSTLVRRGFLSRVTPAWEREADITVRLEFLAVEADDADVVATDPSEATGTSTADLADILDEVSAAADELYNAAVLTSGALAALAI